MTTRVQQNPSRPPSKPLAPASESHIWLILTRKPWIAAAIFLVVSLSIWWFGSQWYEERLLLEQRARAVSELSARGSALSSAVSRRLARLQGLYAFVLSEGDEPDFADKFELFAEDLYAGSRGIRNLAVAPQGEMQFVYPKEGNEMVLGYNPLLDHRPEIAADVQRAIDTQQLILSGPTELLQGGLGLIARQAVYLDRKYWGLVNLVLDVPTILAEVGIEGGAGELVYAIRSEYGHVFYGSPDIFDRSPIITQIVLPEGHWELAGAAGFLGCLLRIVHLNEALLPTAGP